MTTHMQTTFAVCAMILNALAATGFPDPSGWCCLLAKEVAHTFPACKAIRCETMENDLSAASLVTFSSTVAPLLVDPEVKEYMTDANALPVGQAMVSRTRFEGDIMGIDVDEKMTDAGSKLLANFIKDERKRWLKGIIPYDLSKAFRPMDKQKVRDAMAAVQSQTCVKYRLRKSTDVDYLVVAPGFGCSSYVGRQGGKQFTVLQITGCMESGIIQHELLHGLGFYHEQSRSDRDKYVDINWANLSEEDRKQFQKYTDAEVTAFGEPYDFKSIMHYAPHDFARDPTQYTIRSKPGKAIGIEIGQRVALSPIDINKINFAYCEAKGPCPVTIGWAKFQQKCYFFSFLASAPKRSFVQARNYCRKTQSVIFNPGENYILEFIAATINSNPAVDPEERVWVSSCQTLTANINQSLDVHEDDCDGIWHFICERVVDK